jgi:hypothetical protein
MEAMRIPARRTCQVGSVRSVSDALTEAVQRLVLMEADLARFLDVADGQTEGPGADSFAELIAMLIANQRQVIETLIAVAEEIAALKVAASAGVVEV